MWIIPESYYPRYAPWLNACWEDERPLKEWITIDQLYEVLKSVEAGDMRTIIIRGI